MDASLVSASGRRSRRARIGWSFRRSPSGPHRRLRGLADRRILDAACAEELPSASARADRVAHAAPQRRQDPCCTRAARGGSVVTSAPRQVTDINGVRYALLRQLGRGGQGAVYEVDGGRLAAKVVFDSSSSRRERLRNQLTQVKRLPISDLEIARPIEMLREPVLGYVMELLTGMQPLKTLAVVPKDTPSPAAWYFEGGGLRRRLQLLARSADVLAALHGKGLVYSDPSPHNIFVSESRDANEVRFIDADNIHYASIAGVPALFTPGYGAPELVRCLGGVNSLTDAHAFAVLAFQTLSLVHPLIGDDIANGAPEREEEALAGRRPWIDDPTDDSNRTSCGIPRTSVLSPRLLEIRWACFRSRPPRRHEAPWCSRVGRAPTRGCGRNVAVLVMQGNVLLHGEAMSLVQRASPAVRHGSLQSLGPFAWTWCRVAAEACR